MKKINKRILIAGCVWISYLIISKIIFKQTIINTPNIISTTIITTFGLLLRNIDIDNNKNIKEFPMKIRLRLVAVYTIVLFLSLFLFLQIYFFLIR